VSRDTPSRASPPVPLRRRAAARARRCLKRDGEGAHAAGPGRARAPGGGPGGACGGGGRRGAGRCALAVPPKLAMSLLKERDLRERLRAFGLPTLGRRPVRA